MKNNKGFSLVELIIVIAIMAILVGVMAPQLIKYIEKTNVSADIQFCDTVKGAITTAVMDPAVLTNTSAKVPTFGSTVALNTVTATAYPVFAEQVQEIVGFDFTQSNAIKNHYKSSAKSNAGDGDMKFKIDSSTNGVLVWIENSDISGKKSKHTTPSATATTSCIFAGDANIY